MYINIFSLLLEPISILSAFFYSILKKDRQIPFYRALRLFIHMVYVLLLSIYLGFILSVFVLVSIAILMQWNFQAGMINILAGVLSIFVILSLIVIQRRNDNDFNLPEVFINSIILLIAYLKSKHILKALGIILLFSFILMFTLVMFITNIPIPKTFIPTLIMGIPIVSTTTIICLYWIYTPKNPLLRSLRTFSLSLLFTGGTVGASLFRAHLYAKQGFDVASTVDILLIFSSVLSFKQIIDAWLELYNQFCLVNSEQLKSIWNSLENNYSYVRLLNVINNQKYEIVSAIRISQRLWRTGKKLHVIKGIVISVLFMIVGFAFLLNSDKFQLFMNNLVKWLWKLWVEFVGNENTATIITFTIFLVVAFVWNSIMFVKKFKIFDRNKKLILIGRLVFISMLLLTMVCAIGNIRMDGIILYILLFLFLLLGVLSFFIKIEHTS